MSKKIRYELGKRTGQEPRSILFVARKLGDHPNISFEITTDLLNDPDLGGFLSIIINSIREYAKENDITIWISPLEKKET